MEQHPNEAVEDSFIKPDLNELEMKHCLNKNSLVVSNQQISLSSTSTSSHEANSLNGITYIKPDPDDMEYHVNKTYQSISNQQVSLSSPLKCDFKEEMMYCQFCSYSDVDLDRLKFHTFTQHPTGAAIVSFGESEHDVKFFCVKETCNFSTTVCTVYVEHLRNCCHLHQILSGKVKERLQSTLQFVLDFHNKHCLSDVTGLLEYFSSFNRTYTSENLQLRQHMEHKDLLPSVSRPSSLSDIKSSMVCGGVEGKKLQSPFSSVPNPVPVFIFQNQNTNFVERKADISENFIAKTVKQNKNDEQLLTTGPSELKISKLQVHTPFMETQIEKKFFSCADCDKFFQYRSDLLTHMSLHSGGKQNNCDMRDVFTFSNQANVQKRTNTGEKLFKCDVCDRDFVDSSSLIQHKRTHKAERPFKCDVCDKKFTRSCHLTVHKRTHTGEKPFKCDVCDKEFIRSTHLIVHKRTHTGEKPFKCDVCDKKFTYSSQINVHKRTHTGEKPFKCGVCDKDFADSSTLIQHKRTHTGEKPFKCDVCDKKFTNSSQVKVHKRIHTGERPFKCNDCDKGFADSSTLNKHKKTHRGEKSFI